MRGRLAVLALVVVVLGAASALLLARRADGPRTARTAPPATLPMPVPVPGPSEQPVPRPVPPPPVVGPEPTAPAVPLAQFAARLVRRTQLRAQPGGRVVRAVGTLTGYGSPRVLAVVERRGDWLGVLSDHMPNSRAAWIPASSAELEHERYRLDADLSQRRVTVRRDGRVVRRIRVAIGAPATPTPTGLFGVTDGLRIGPEQPEYGCCALALSGRQGRLPTGWSTSDRLAIHGTPNDTGFGAATTFGCLHAREADMHWLLRRIDVGTLLRIRA